MRVINHPTHPKRPRVDVDQKRPVWWGGPNYVRNKKRRNGTKHKLGTRKGEMIRDSGSR